jgi:hypothetical protein
MNSVLRRCLFVVVAILAVLLLSALAHASGAGEQTDKATAADQARAAALKAAQVRVAQPGITVAPDGTIHAPAGSTVEMTQERADSDKRPSHTRAESARASGAGMSTDAAEAKIGQENQPSSVQLGGTDATGLGGGPASGTSGGSSTKAEVRGVRWEIISLFVAGAVLIGLGAWRGQAGGIRAAFWFIGAGLLLIGTGFVGLIWPEAILLGLGAGALVLIVGYLDESRDKAQVSRAREQVDHRAHDLEISLVSVARGIAALPEPMRTDVLRSISNQTDHADEATVKRTITDIKFKAGVK